MKEQIVARCVYTSRTMFEHAFIVSQKVNLSSCIAVPKLNHVGPLFQRVVIMSLVAICALSNLILFAGSPFLAFAVSLALHDGFLIPTRNLPFFRICTQSSDDCVLADFREITKCAARCVFELRRGFRLKRWIALPTKNDVLRVNKASVFSFCGAL